MTYVLPSTFNGALSNYIPGYSEELFVKSVRAGELSRESAPDVSSTSVTSVATVHLTSPPCPPLPCVNTDTLQQSGMLLLLVLVR